MPLERPRGVLRGSVLRGVLRSVLRGIFYHPLNFIENFFTSEATTWEILGLSQAYRGLYTIKTYRLF